MTPNCELTPFYEQGRMLESDEDLEACIEQAFIGLSNEGKAGQFRADAIRAIKEGFKDSANNGYPSPSYGG